ncbi:MAG: hypothetical protein K0S47_1487 [Herbinix sp.]|jgi:septum formation protein|nr:hypothetical protein [Herbinix sp.]
MNHIILASESPRRKEIMETMGITFDVMGSNLPEIVTETEPAKIVESLAEMKTRHIGQRLKEMNASLSEQQEDIIVIGADTMVFAKGQVLGKPKDKEDAIRMIQMLSDSSHDVFTGVAVLVRKEGKEDQILRFSVDTKVVVFPLTIEQIIHYVGTGEPMDKAGAYAIQGQFGIYIKEIVGDYYNIVGLPISRIYQELLSIGIDLKK